MKKQFLIKLTTHPQPVTILADDYRVDERTQLLRLVNLHPRAGQEGALVENVFSAMASTWQWVRLVGYAE